LSSVTLTNRPGDTGDSTDSSGARRPRPRLDRTPRSDSDPRHEDGKGRPRPRTRPVQTSPAIVTNGDVMAADASFAAKLEAVTDTAPASDKVEAKDVRKPSSAPKVDLAALATAAVPVVEPDTQLARAKLAAERSKSAATAAAASAKASTVVEEAPATVISDQLPTSAVARTAASVASAPLPLEPVRGAGSVPSKKKTRSVVGRRRRPRVRRVRRVVRSIDTWTVFKVSTLFWLVAYAIVLVAGVLLWNLAYATGTIENLQDFFTDFGWETFQFEGGKLFHSAWIIGLFLVIAGIGLNVTLATVFNLISDLVGGIGVTVLEEEVRVVPQATPEAE
jgi:Transmembrane domain of unknown function (DUF3566)